MNMGMEATMSSSDSLPVTVVIPTIGRRKLLQRCLTSVLACDPQAREVIVVDQSGGRDGGAVAGALGVGRVRVVYCQRKGIARARNIGLREARFNVVLMTDDDCTVATNWIAQAVRMNGEVPDGIVTGRVLSPPGSRYVPSSKSSTEAEDFTGHISAAALYSNNMVLKRSLALDIGGFDERDGLRLAAEDNDFCYRWLRAGHSLRYEPSLVVWHQDWRSRAEIVGTHINYARGQGVFYAKHLYAHDWQTLKLL